MKQNWNRLKIFLPLIRTRSMVITTELLWTNGPAKPLTIKPSVIRCEIST